MINLTNLKKIKSKKYKKAGRGPGSGKGKTSGRGTKGQNARGKIPITHAHYEGGQRPLFKRLPYKRGKGNKKISPKPLVVSIEKLASLPEKTIISPENLIKLKIIQKNEAKKPVKILGNEKLTKKLEFKVGLSKKLSSSLNLESKKSWQLNTNRL